MNKNNTASSGKTVLVTGGAGFIGSHLVDRLVGLGYNVRVLDNLSTGSVANIKSHLNSSQVDFVGGDIRDKSFVRECLQDVDMVVHLAAIVSVPFSVANPELTFDVNVDGTNGLLDLCEELGVGKFVFASSCAVYGDPAYLPVSENARIAPLSPYAESKLAGEHSCLERRGLRSVVLRLFNVYGTRQGLSEYSGVITRFLDCIKHREPLVVFDDGLQTRDFVNVADVVGAVLASIESVAAEGKVINIGSGKATTVNDLADTLLQLSGVDLQVLHMSPRAGDIRHSYADVSKAKKILGYEPKVSLPEGLQVLLKELSVSGPCI